MEEIRKVVSSEKFGWISVAAFYFVAAPHVATNQRNATRSKWLVALLFTLGLIEASIGLYIVTILVSYPVLTSITCGWPMRWLINGTTPAAKIHHHAVVIVPRLRKCNKISLSSLMCMRKMRLSIIILAALAVLDLNSGCRYCTRHVPTHHPMCLGRSIPKHI